VTELPDESPEGVWLDLLDGQCENQVGYSIQPPGAYNKRIPHRPGWSGKSDRRPKMCRYWKDDQNCPRAAGTCTSSRFGSRRGQQKARTL